MLQADGGQDLSGVENLAVVPRKQRLTRNVFFVKPFDRLMSSRSQKHGGRTNLFGEALGIREPRHPFPRRDLTAGVNRCPAHHASSRRRFDHGCHGVCRSFKECGHQRQRSRGAPVLCQGQKRWMLAQRDQEGVLGFLRNVQEGIGRAVGANHLMPQLTGTQCFGSLQNDHS